MGKLSLSLQSEGYLVPKNVITLGEVVLFTNEDWRSVLDWFVDNVVVLHQFCVGSCAAEQIEKIFFPPCLEQDEYLSPEAFMAVGFDVPFLAAIKFLKISFFQVKLNFLATCSQGCVVFFLDHLKCVKKKVEHFVLFVNGVVMVDAFHMSFKYLPPLSVDSVSHLCQELRSWNCFPANFCDNLEISLSFFLAPKLCLNWSDESQSTWWF